MPATRRTGWAMLGVVCALVIGFYTWITTDAQSDWGSVEPRGAYYNLLVEGWAAGQLSLAVAVPAGLSQLADPYDPQANAVYRTRFHLHDTSYYQGRLYLYFGPTPALVLYGPFHWLTGGYLRNNVAALLFAVAGFAGGVALLCFARRRYFGAAPNWVVACIVVAFGVTSSVPALLRIPGVTHVAIACAYAFVMLTCLAVWQACHSDRQRIRWLALASFSYGLAVGARPSVLFGALILLVPLALPVSQTPPADSGRTSRWRLFIAAVLPLSLVGIALATYNYARFDNLLEFGQRYQLAGDRQDAARHFSAGYLWSNFRLYFLRLPRWSHVFPFINDGSVTSLPEGHAPVESAQGIFSTAPIALFAFASLRLLYTGPGRVLSALRGWLIGGWALFLTSAFILCLFYGTVLRYQTEFQPTLILLAGIGLLALENSAHRRWWRAAWLPALVLSVGVAALTNLKMLAVELNAQGTLLAQDGRPAEAIAKFQSALHIKSDLVPAHANLGQLLLEQGHTGEALPHFKVCVALQPDSAEAHSNLGRAYAAQQRQAEAAAEFETALRLQPTYIPGHINLAAMYYYLNRPRDAVKQYEAAIALGYDERALHDALVLVRRAAQGAETPAR